MATKDEPAKKNALSLVKDIYKQVVEKYGTTNANWAFRRVVEYSSQRDRLLKRKGELEKELQEIQEKI